MAARDETLGLAEALLRLRPRPVHQVGRVVLRRIRQGVVEDRVLLGRVEEPEIVADLMGEHGAEVAGFVDQARRGDGDPRSIAGPYERWPRDAAGDPQDDAADLLVVEVLEDRCDEEDVDGTSVLGLAGEEELGEIVGRPRGAPDLGERGIRIHPGHVVVAGDLHGHAGGREALHQRVDGALDALVVRGRSGLKAVRAREVEMDSQKPRLRHGALARQDGHVADPGQAHPGEPGPR